MDDFSRFVPNVHYELIPIKNLVSNQDYQRNLSMKHVQKAAENFDLCQINPVKVSRRDGINYVFNGQHTIEIVAAISESRETPVWCMIYEDLEYEHEADIFANQMKYVKALMPYEIFMANLEAGSEKHLMIKDLVESYDLTITHGAIPGGICAVSTLEQIYDKYGYHTLDRVLRLCIGTWEGENHSLCANMLNGVARLVDAYGESLKDDIFKEKNGVVSVKSIIRTAKERHAGALGYAETLLLNYNKKMPGSSALPMEKLYTNRKKTAKPEVFEDDFDPEEPITWSCNEPDEEVEPIDESEQLTLDIE